MAMYSCSWDEQVTKGKKLRRAESAEPLTTGSDDGRRVGNDVPEKPQLEPEAAASVTPADEG